MGEELLKKLEKTRQLMIQSGMEHGLQNEKTIRLSRRLDKLMNQLDRQLLDSKRDDDVCIKCAQ